MPGPFPFYFAWAGGTITDTTTLVTNGTTHGALPETRVLVADSGDPDTGGQQLINIASTAGLDEYGYYQITGPGITAGTYFMFDNSVLSGRPGSINLSHSASSATSAQFIATKAINLGAAVATLSQGSSTISISLGLSAGTYSIFGPGIGETDIPLGTTEGTYPISGSTGGILIVGAALLDYNGSGSGTMHIFAAVPHTLNRFDEFGQLNTVTTYTVSSQPVRATTTTTTGIGIAGFISEDRLLIDHIPSGVLSGLEPGLLYNITGSGLETGSTFVAPSGGTEITLDQPATTSEVNAILTITGPRTPNAPFDPSVHNRFDEDVLSVDITHDEGGFATLTVEIKNPNIGLLAIGRNLWCWLSWDQAWPGGTPDLVPLFNGRLIGVPKLSAGEVVQLQFLARPDDLNAQKTSIWGDLAELPYYDPIWFSQQPTTDTVLETYSALWHIDRVSLEATVSDILEGEDGTFEVGEDQAFYDAFSLSYGQPPLIATTVTGTVTWAQQAEGEVEVTPSIISAFSHAGSAYANAFPIDSRGSGGGGLIQTLVGDGLKNDWPKAGTSIGGGWTLSPKQDSRGVPLCYCNDALQPAGWMNPAFVTVSYYTDWVTGGIDVGQNPNPDQVNAILFNSRYGRWVINFQINVYKIRMVLEYRADRTRTETVTAVMTAGVQRELSDSSESDREAISFSSNFVDKAVDPNGALPIGFTGYKSYFQTARGNLSLQYLLLAARAKLRARARAVDVTFGTSWDNALGITLRHNVQLSDRRLPGGVCTGKVKSLHLVANAEGMFGEFTIGCSIGTGIGTDPAAGTPTYVNAGYMNAGYQVIAGEQLPIAALDDFYYQSLDDFVVLDDGLDFTNLRSAHFINECRVINGMAVQMPLLQRYNNSIAPRYGDPLNEFMKYTTQVTLDMKPVAGGEFTTAFFPAITELKLPMTINLGGTAESIWDSSTGIWDTGDSVWDHMAPLP